MTLPVPRSRCGSRAPSTARCSFSSPATSAGAYRRRDDGDVRSRVGRSGRADVAVGALLLREIHGPREARRANRPAGLRRPDGVVVATHRRGAPRVAADFGLAPGVAIAPAAARRILRPRC